MGVKQLEKQHLDGIVFSYFYIYMHVCISLDIALMADTKLKEIHVELFKSTCIYLYVAI